MPDSTEPGTAPGLRPQRTEDVGLAGVRDEGVWNQLHRFKRDRRFVLLLWLSLATLSVLWFDYAAASAVFHPFADPTGNVNYQVPGYSNTVYPFTYVGVAASVLGVAYFVTRTEYSRGDRRRLLLLAVTLGVLAGNVASVGMLNSFEQTFLFDRLYTPEGHGASVYWFQLYWGDIRSASQTAYGMLLVLAVLPWSRKANWPTVTLLLASFLLAMGVWHNYAVLGPESGIPVDYFLNSVTRVLSQLILVAAVATKDPLRLVFDRVRAGRANERR